MVMTLLMSLHSGDPEVIENADLQVPDYSGVNDLQVIFGLHPSEVQYMSRWALELEEPGSTGSNPGRNISVPGALVEDDVITLGKSLHCTLHLLSMCFYRSNKK